MAAVLKRLLTPGLMLALVVGTTSQLMPSSVAHADMGLRADMTDGDAGPQPPCTGHMPNCIDYLGCGTVSTLPASPVAIAVVFEWTSLNYDFAPTSLSGMSVKPELSPPILAA